VVVVVVVEAFLWCEFVGIEIEIGDECVVVGLDSIGTMQYVVVWTTISRTKHLLLGTITPNGLLLNH